jgi:hypothetical protein
MFFEEDEEVRHVNIVCSSGIRRGYEKTSVFFVHPLFRKGTPWPQTTDICCYHDCEPFEGSPVPLPIGYTKETNTYKCGPALFCSGACAKAFMISHPRHNNALCLMWLKQLLRSVFRINDNFTQAPPKQTLKRFGGPLDVISFRNLSGQKKRVIMHTEPFMVCSLAFELLDEQKLVEEHPDNEMLVTQEKVTKQIRKIRKRLKAVEIEHDREAAEEDAKALAAASHILLPGVSIVKADVANKWEIRDLKRPDAPLKAQRQRKYTNTASLFDEYKAGKELEQRAEPEKAAKAAAARKKRVGRPRVKKLAPVKAAPSKATKGKDTRGNLDAFFV